MGRVLAVDLGARRTGLAVSDPSRVIAQPVGSIPGGPPAEVAPRILAEARRRQCDEVVVGLPKLLNGAEGEGARGAREAARLLREAGLKVHLLDERLTSVQAERSLLAADLSRRRRRELSDQVAATLLLQAFLARASRV